MVLFIIPLVLLGVPLLIVQLVNMGVFSEFTVCGISFNKMENYRGNEVGFDNLWSRLLGFISCMIGSDGFSFNAFREIGPVYLCMVPLVLSGFILGVRDVLRSIKNKAYASIAVILCFLLASWIAMLLYDYNFNKVNHIYIAFLVLIVYGMINIGMISGKSAAVCLTSFCISFIVFTGVYFVWQKQLIEQHEYFYSTELGDVIEYSVKQFDSHEEKVIYVTFNPEEDYPYGLIVGMYGRVPAPLWNEGETVAGRFCLGLPEQIDPGENALYITNSNQSSFATSLTSSGYKIDNTFESYSVLYR